MSWVILAGDDLHFSLQLVQMSGVRFLVMVSPGQPMAIHACSVLYGKVSVGSRGMQVTLHGLLFLSLFV